ncbi:hypothetical protein P2H44_13680 [Albimonas sp. CAU 1670]|uniref:hypothetical protein n=1 Tax=Albimonas sp. CAU 1670 TaxID=3032599 RepID=UPI0023DBC193|nr:hypothetical protein [Albimonas sp. CAU 1670]MDF2233605.1 hypothetical protein [Albimonas sp. CAU 1670]
MTPPDPPAPGAAATIPTTMARLRDAALRLRGLPVASRSRAPAGARPRRPLAGGRLGPILALAAALLATGPAPAQSPAAVPDAQSPRLSVELSAEEVVPGQPLTLRMTLLVPTYLPSPPVWPDLDAPDLLVRLPPRATNPTSAEVDGETWSGVSRRWRIAPLVPGAFALPAGELQVTWADPAGGAPLRAVLPTPALRLRATIPPGAEDLSPFIAAQDLTLERRVEGDPQAMSPGDALAVTLTARIAGASPMVLPPLAAPGGPPGLAAYPEAPELTETEDRGRIGGARTERLSLIAQGGGEGELPAVSLRWYDLDDGRVKTAEVPAVAISVSGPPLAAAPPDPAARLRLWLSLGAAALALGVLAALLRRAAPGLRARLSRRRAAHRASETWAWRRLRSALRARDRAGLRPALDLWSARVQGDPRADPAVQAALLSLGAARYAPGQGDEAAAWQALARALPEARRRHPPLDARGPSATAPRRLPPLNPVA